MFLYLLSCGLYDLRFDTRQSQETPAFSRTSKLALGHSWLLIQWVPGELVPCIKRLQHEFNHSHPSRDENEWSNTDTSPHPPFARTVSTGTTPLFGKKKICMGSQVFRNIAVVTGTSTLPISISAHRPLQWPTLNFYRYCSFLSNIQKNGDRP